MTPTETTLDVIVVGAGPAGAIAAHDLASAGVRVAIVDGSHPREKPCGGGVTGRALELVRLDPTSIPSRTISDVTFAALDGSNRHEVSISIPEANILRVYAREVFDAALLSRAARAGAAHINARVRRLDRDHGTWRIETTTGDLRAAWVVGADGASGVVRKRVFRPFERAQLSIAAGSYVDDVDSASIVIGFISTPRGYLWSFPRPGHLAVGACAQADETSSAALQEISDRWIDAYPPAARQPRQRYAWPIPSLDARAVDREQPSGDGWMLAGDAAGLVDPITREGIFFALRSGQLAAAALGTRDPGRRYAEAVCDELHDELRRAAILKAGFFKPRFIHLLIDALGDSNAIQRVMVDLIAGRQPYRGLRRRLVGTMELGWIIRALTAPRSRCAS